MNLVFVSFRLSYNPDIYNLPRFVLRLKSIDQVTRMRLVASYFKPDFLARQDSTQLRLLKKIIWLGLWSNEDVHKNETVRFRRCESLIWWREVERAEIRDYFNRLIRSSFEMFFVCFFLILCRLTGSYIRNWTCCRHMNN